MLMRESEPVLICPAFVRGDGDVSYSCIFRLAQMMADHCRVAILFGKFNGVQGLGERTDLVYPNQDRFSDAFSDPSAEEFDLGYGQVIAYELDLWRRASVSFFQPTQSFSNSRPR